MAKTKVIQALAAMAIIAAAGANPVAAGGMMWSTFLGGSAVDRVNAVATDAAGNIVLVGTTYSSDFPTAGGGFRSSVSGYGDVMVAKLDPAGTTLLWSARLGGGYLDDGRAVAVDAAGNVFVTGYTESKDFSVINAAFRSTNAGMVDGFLAKLSPNGALLASTYFGGGRQDWGFAIGVGADGAPVIAGTTESINFPTSGGVMKPGRVSSFTDVTDGFLMKFNAACTGLVYSTYMGSTNASDGIFGLALDGAGQATVAGWTYSQSFPTTVGAYDRMASTMKEGFVARVNASGSGLVFSTYLGGPNADEARSVAIDGAGNVVVAGITGSNGFPVTAGAVRTSYGGGLWDAFVLKLNSSGSSLMYSTYLGGSGSDRAFGVLASASGDVWVTGETGSANFPMTAGAFDASLNGTTDGFVIQLSPTGEMVYSSFIGANGADAGNALGLQGSNLLLVGQTDSGAFPSTSSKFDNTMNSPGVADGFVTCWSAGVAANSLSTASVGDGGIESMLRVDWAATPNPFRGRMMVQLSLAHAGHVELAIRDLQGRRVNRLASGDMAAGNHSWTWDGRGQSGEPMSAGVYFMEIATPDGSARRSITLIK